MNSVLFKKKPYLQTIQLKIMYNLNLALNNQQWLIHHKTNQPINQSDAT